MAQADRERLVKSERTIFQRDSQRSDFLDPSKTHDSTVSVVLQLIDKGYFILFTAVNSDHHNDSGLGLHSHHNGYAFDCWPNNTARADDYMIADTHPFRQFLVDAAKAHFEFQLGLAGSADDQADRIAAGHTVFSDDGGDHVHIGTSY